MPFRFFPTEPQRAQSIFLSVLCGFVGLFLLNYHIKSLRLLPDRSFHFCF